MLVFAVLALFADVEVMEPAMKTRGLSPKASGGFPITLKSGNPYRVVYENQLLGNQQYKADGLVSEFASSHQTTTLQLVQQVEQTINDGYDLILISTIACNGS